MEAIAGSVSFEIQWNNTEKVMTKMVNNQQ